MRESGLEGDGGRQSMKCEVGGEGGRVQIMREAVNEAQGRRGAREPGREAGGRRTAADKSARYHRSTQGRVNASDLTRWLSTCPPK